jgi:hypothetical protein
MPHTPGHVSAEMKRCIDECLSCYRVCMETLIFCIAQGGRHAEPRHLQLLMDCAEICRTSADFMLRGSELHVETCAVCADVCERCAQSCDAMGDDATMRACAEACRRCAESCRTMSGGVRVSKAA